jgi:hypothetical protein
VLPGTRTPELATPVPAAPKPTTNGEETGLFSQSNSDKKSRLEEERGAGSLAKGKDDSSKLT